MDWTVVMENNPQLSRDLYKAVDRIWWYSYLRHIAIEKCDNNGLSWCIRFDDENKMICKYILPITLARTGQFSAKKLSLKTILLISFRST